MSIVGDVDELVSDAQIPVISLEVERGIEQQAARAPGVGLSARNRRDVEDADGVRCRSSHEELVADDRHPLAVAETDGGGSREGLERVEASVVEGHAERHRVRADVGEPQATGAVVLRPHRGRSRTRERAQKGAESDASRRGAP
jgi:hypothetical protein